MRQKLTWYKERKDKWEGTGLSRSAEKREAYVITEVGRGGG